MDDIWVVYELGQTALNDATRTAVDYNERGQDSPRRPYTAEENAAADERAAAAARAVNQTVIEQALNDALTTLQALIDTPNSVIKADPQSYIKDLARIQRRQIRLLLKRLDGTS